MMARRATVRNIFLVASLFALAAVMILVVQFRKPYAPYEEPRELVEKRLDRENNSYYALVDLVHLLPMPPLPVPFIKNEEGEEVHFKPEPGSVADLTRIGRPDGDPLVLDYIQKTKPVVEQARAAASKPFFLYPPVDWALSYEQVERPVFENLSVLQLLTALLVVDAASKPCSPDPAQDACRLMQQALDLSFKMNADRYRWFENSERFAADVIRNSCPEHLREMLSWLDKTRRGWAPPRAGIEFSIRYLLKEEFKDPNYQPRFWKRMSDAAEGRIMFSRDELFVRRHEKLYREAAELTILQYDRQKEKFKPILSPPRRWHDLCLHAASITTNSQFFARIDGLSIVVALELYRHDHGAYPNSLKNLVPDYLKQTPKSPYDGSDFEYRRQASDYELSCKVTSVGYYRAMTHARKLIFHAPRAPKAAP